MGTALPTPIDLAEEYESLVRSVLCQRWKKTSLRGDVDDAVQEFFLESLKPCGALARYEERSDSHRAYFLSVARNVARRFEERAARDARRRQAGMHATRRPDATIDQRLDRAWARAVLMRAAIRFRRRVSTKTYALFAAVVAGQTIAVLARDQDIPAAPLYRVLERARAEFRLALDQELRSRGDGQRRTVDAFVREVRFLLRP